MAKEQSFLKRHSIVTMLLGILLVVIGCVVISKNGTLITIVMAVGLIISGLSGLQTVFSYKFTSSQWKLVTLFKAIISILLGVIAIIYSKESTKVIMYIMGAQMAISGVVSICDAILLKKNTGVPVSSVVSDGVFSLVVAVVLFVFPTFVSTTIGVVLGVILLVSGLALAAWAFLIRRADKSFEKEEGKTVETTGEILDEKK
jgi:uncharacterized membrane protein HdeD (DUF308 family)